MAFSDVFLPEFDHEMENTRTVLEVVPDQLLDWKAADDLNSIRWVASHIADTLSWVEVTLKETSFDIAPIDGPKHASPLLDSGKAIVETFDQNVAHARQLLTEITDDELQVVWTLLQGGQELFSMPRMALVKNLFINHIVHHRAFLIAYLRMNGVSCPPMYG